MKTLDKPSSSSEDIAQIGIRFDIYCSKCKEDSDIRLSIPELDINDQLTIKDYLYVGRCQSCKTTFCFRIYSFHKLLKKNFPHINMTREDFLKSREQDEKFGLNDPKSQGPIASEILKTKEKMH